MFLVTSNKRRQVLHLMLGGRVTQAELQDGKPDVAELLGELSRGFTLITDLERMVSIDPECFGAIGHTMELCEQHGVGRVIRVIPEPSKDIGFNILSVFHYSRTPETTVCRSLVEAIEALGS